MLNGKNTMTHALSPETLCGMPLKILVLLKFWEITTSLHETGKLKWAKNALMEVNMDWFEQWQVAKTHNGPFYF